MSRLYFSNFDFEAGLAAHLPAASRTTERRNSELAFGWLAIARPGDVIVTPEPPGVEFAKRLNLLGRPGVTFVRPDESVRRDLNLVPWGWETRVLRWADRRGMKVNGPDVDVVRDINSRRFSFECELEWGCGLEGQAVCGTVGAVERTIRFMDSWVIKSLFSSAGRQRVCGSGPLDTEAVRWLERTLKRDGAVCVEPYVNCLGEAGVQWEVPCPPEAPELVGVAGLLTDDRGQYRGSVFSPAEQASAWNEVIEKSRRAVVRAQERGYRGALGIDAMRYRDAGGHVRYRALMDVNARFTMGRLSLGWRDRLPADGQGIQWCGRVADSRTASAGAETTLISPETLSGTATGLALWLELSRIGSEESNFALAEPDSL